MQTQREYRPRRRESSTVSFLLHWTELSKMLKTYEGMVHLMLLEQFLAMHSQDLKTFPKERPCISLKEVGQPVDV